MDFGISVSSLLADDVPSADAGAETQSVAHIPPPSYSELLRLHLLNQPESEDLGADTNESYHGLDRQRTGPRYDDALLLQQPLGTHTDYTTDNRPTNERPHRSTPKNAVLLKDVLNSDSPVLNNAATDDHERGFSPRKRRKPDPSSTLLTLPTPHPPSKKVPRRRLLPPVLSGLEQPPPDAGLLPSITAGAAAPQHLPPASSRVRARQDTRITGSSEQKDREGTSQKEVNGTDKAERAPKVKRRNKWTDAETAHLLKGVARFGIGSWKKILACPEYTFNGRTAVDLKDRFRTCCPDDYRSLKTSNNRADAESRSILHADPSVQETVKTPAKVQVTHRKKPEDLKELGITAPFQKRARRDRCVFTKEEDAALMRGFQKYGPSWKRIRRDTELGLMKRTSTDLRDRFRNHWPEEYAAVGKKLQAAKSGKKDDSKGDQENAPGSPSDRFARPKSPPSNADPLSAPTTASTTDLSTQRLAHKPTQYLTFDDSLLSDFSLGSDEDPTSIRLGRDIFDWFAEQSNNNRVTNAPQSATSNPNNDQQQHASTTLPPATSLSAGPQTHINPLMTLKTARPPATGSGGVNLPSLLLAVPLTELPWSAEENVNLPPATDVFSPSELGVPSQQQQHGRNETAGQQQSSVGTLAPLPPLLWDF